MGTDGINYYLTRTGVSGRLRIFLTLPNLFLDFAKLLFPLIRIGQGDRDDLAPPHIHVFPGSRYSTGVLTVAERCGNT